MMERLLHEIVRITDKNSSNYGELGMVQEEFNGLYTIEIFSRDIMNVFKRDQFCIAKEEK